MGSSVPIHKNLDAPNVGVPFISAAASRPPWLYMHTAYTLFVMNTWDEPKRQFNLKDHGIDVANLDGFFDGDLLTREDTRETHGEARYQRIGVFEGIALFVAWTPRGEEGDIPHIISARKAVTHEYQAWLARYSKR